MARILILEDNIEVVDTLKGMLEDEGHVVEAEMNPSLVMERIRRFEPHLITLDISFSEHRDETGILLLHEIRKVYPKARLPILVISGTADADKLTRMTALDINGYLGKPVKCGDLHKKINEALEPQNHASALTGPWEARMVGGSPAILELIPEIGKAAKAESDLLVTGESGVGKEQVVQKYRELSPRPRDRFVVVDCTTISPHTFESEIFGHEKGAFTGASEAKAGKIEAAAGGIVFFDEIGDLPEPQQQKLLRLLQHKTFTRMGSNHALAIDVVVLAATNKPLHTLMQQGVLRKDFYYRLQYMRVEMPPLRDHLEDIPALVDHFIQKANGEFHKAVVGVEPEVIQNFQQMQWDGNVRQLEKCLESAVLKCDGQRLKWRDVVGYFKDETQASRGAGALDFDLSMRYDDFKRFLKADESAKERRYYLHHLQQNDFNIQKTARSLGVARTYLNVILKRLRIDKPQT